MPTAIQAAFNLGLSAAETLYGVARRRDAGFGDAVIALLTRVAASEVTMVDSAAEIAAAMPGLSQEAAARLPEATRRAMARQRLVAQRLLSILSSTGGTEA